MPIDNFANLFRTPGVDITVGAADGKVTIDLGAAVRAFKTSPDNARAIAAALIKAADALEGKKSA